VSVLTEEGFAKFTAFRVRAMGQRLREMCEDESYDTWTFEEKVKEMIDAEDAARQARKITKLVREARFKEPAACVEDIIYMPERKLSRDRIARLAECSWVEADEVLVAISKTGSGKSYIAQALGNAACRRLLPTRYVRLADLCCELNRARMASDGSYYRAMDRFKSVKLLIIDDFLTTPIETVNSVDLFEILEAREGRRSTLIASQLEPNEWYLRIEGELIADFILGRVASVCRCLDIEGPNMRKWLAENRPREG
jgi:DNA replication protein DnaC